MGATGALLIVVLATSALHGGGGGAAAKVEPSASTFSFAPTTTGGDSLGRPAEGVVHLVATTVDGTKVASGVVLDARGTIATTAAAVLGATGVAAYLADGTEYEATMLGVDDESGAAVVRRRRPAPRRVQRLGRHPVGGRHACTPAAASRPPPSTPSA